MAKKDEKPPEKPKGWEKLARAGSRRGAKTGWDPESKRHYHVNRDGSVQFHEQPEGATLDTDGAGQPVFIPAGMAWETAEKLRLVQRESQAGKPDEVAAPAPTDHHEETA